MKMKSEESYYKGINLYFFLILFTSMILIVEACTDTIIPDQNTSGELSEIERKASAVSDPISQDPIVQRAEASFIQLSNKLPGFGGYYLNTKKTTAKSDDELIVWFKGDDNASVAAEKVRQHVNRILESKNIRFTPSQIVVKKASYNFRQLQAIRDILHEPILDNKGVTFVDLAEDNNRVEIGIIDQSYSTSVETTLTNLDIPRESVNIEITGHIDLATNYDFPPIGNYFTNAILTHLKLTDKVRPITGGLEWNNKCTIGIIVKFGTKNGWVTASHCTPTTAGLDPDYEAHQPEFSSLFETNEVIGVEVRDPPPPQIQRCKLIRNTIGCRSGVCDSSNDKWTYSNLGRKSDPRNNG